ncbi:MAG: hypothetical protein QM736_04830 [Vicinamibacterales bacterium]
MLAVAAVDELTAIEAIELIDIDWEALPFNVDPIDSARPGTPTARTEGNVWMRPAAARGGSRSAPDVVKLKWEEKDFAEYAQGKLPMGKPTDEWSYGDVEAGTSKCRTGSRRDVLDVEQQPLDARTAQRDGLLAERQAVHALLDAEHGADRRIGRAVAAHGADRYRDRSANTRVAASAARRPATIHNHSGAPVEEGQRAGDACTSAAKKSTSSAATVPAVHGRVKAGFDKRRQAARRRHVRHLRERTVRAAG